MIVRPTQPAPARRRPLVACGGSRRTSVLLAALLVAVVFQPAHALDTIYLVRHAEKQAAWPDGEGLGPLHPLSDVGIDRARALASALADEPIIAVVASPTTRSIHTGLFTARAHDVDMNVEPRTIDRDQIAAWVAELRTMGDGAAVIVGHSNTIPWFLEELGADVACHDRLGITEASYGPATEFYGGLWRLDLRAVGCDAIELLRFGD